VTTHGCLGAPEDWETGQSVDDNVPFTPIYGQYHQGVVDGAGMAGWDGAGLA
jgi:hypothetical protein